MRLYLGTKCQHVHLPLLGQHPLSVVATDVIKNLLRIFRSTNVPASMSLFFSFRSSSRKYSICSLLSCLACVSISFSFFSSPLLFLPFRLSPSPEFPNDLPLASTLSFPSFFSPFAVEGFDDSPDRRPVLVCSLSLPDPNACDALFSAARSAR